MNNLYFLLPKFRGKRKVGRPEWVYGDAITLPEKKQYDCILTFEGSPREFVEIISGSFGMFTGIKTMNRSMVYDESKEIYTGDIVRKDNSKTTYLVVFLDGSFIGVSKDFDKYGPFTCNIYNCRKELTVIGNIIDNPELF